MTEEEFHAILRTAKGSDYAALTEAEVRKWIGQGLYESNLRPGWLSCCFCTNRNGVRYGLISAEMVRKHFENHVLLVRGHTRVGPSGELRRPDTDAIARLKVAATAECLEVWGKSPPPWATGDAAARLEAQRCELPGPGASELLVTALLRAAGNSGGGTNGTNEAEASGNPFHCGSFEATRASGVFKQKHLTCNRSSHCPTVLL